MAHATVMILKLSLVPLAQFFLLSQSLCLGLRGSGLFLSFLAVLFNLALQSSIPNYLVSSSGQSVVKEGGVCGQFREGIGKHLGPTHPPEGVV